MTLANIVLLQHGNGIGKKNIKPKYKTKIGFFYWTGYMTKTRDRNLFKNKAI